VRCRVAMAWRGVGVEEKPELLRSGDGAKLAVSQRTWYATCEGNKSDVEAWRDNTNEMKEVLVALIVRLTSWSPCHDVCSHRLLAMRPPSKIRQANALYISSF
jgi:hypothetical protein